MHIILHQCHKFNGVQYHIDIIIDQTVTKLHCNVKDARCDLLNFLTTQFSHKIVHKKKLGIKVNDELLR